MAALLVFPYFFDYPFKEYYVSEGGPIQVFSSAGYLVAIVALIRECGWDFVRRHFYFVLLPAAMCLRELDFHVHFSPISITKTSFFVAPEISILAKLVVVALYAVLIGAFVVMARRHWRAFWDGLKAFDPVPLSIAAAAGIAVFSKAIDGPVRKLGAMGVEIGGDVIFTVIVLEEVLELGIPVFLALAAFSFAGRHGRTAGERR